MKKLFIALLVASRTMAAPTVPTQGTCSEPIFKSDRALTIKEMANVESHYPELEAYCAARGFPCFAGLEFKGEEAYIYCGPYQYEANAK